LNLYVEQEGVLYIYFFYIVNNNNVPLAVSVEYNVLIWSRCCYWQI